MTEAEAISLLLKVAREWLECNPSRGNGESGVSSERVREAVELVSLPISHPPVMGIGPLSVRVPNNVSGCMVCGSMPCVCPGGKPKFAPRPWMR